MNPTHLPGSAMISSNVPGWPALLREGTTKALLGEFLKDQQIDKIALEHETNHLGTSMSVTSQLSQSMKASSSKHYRN